MTEHWSDKFKYFKGFNLCLYCSTKLWKPKVFCNQKCAINFSGLLKYGK